MGTRMGDRLYEQENHREDQGILHGAGLPRKSGAQKRFVLGNTPKGNNQEERTSWKCLRDAAKGEERKKEACG